MAYNAADEAFQDLLKERENKTAEELKAEHDKEYGPLDGEPETKESSGLPEGTVQQQPVIEESKDESTSLPEGQVKVKEEIPKSHNKIQFITTESNMGWKKE